YCFIYNHRHTPPLSSFPTRRSSDLIPEQFDQKCVVYELITGREGEWDATNPQFTIYVNGKLVQGLDVNHREIVLAEKAEAGAVRSEEHTSELQSRFDLVCRLLLEKK